jgi:hypothetical protein
MNKPVKYLTLDEALYPIKSGQNLFIHGSAATPLTFAASK